MLTTLRRAAARIPLLGPALKKSYLGLFARDGAVRSIETGPLAGLKYHHYRWSTPDHDLVVNNWADEAAAAFTRLVPGKKRIFDIGANWGFYVLLAHKHRDADCQIIAFEPHPRSARELQTQITLNQIANATVVQSALSDQDGAIEFVDTGSAIGQKMAAVDNYFTTARRIRVPAMSLNTAVDRFGAPDLIKLDVEGAENLVLTGGRDILTRYRPTLIVEVHGPERSNDFYGIVESCHYRCETAAGTPITDRAYHHQVVCHPA
jgi:FkbM family methyltransferase